MPRAAPTPSHVTKCYGLHDPLNPEDSEVQTLGCRHTNPDACKRNGLAGISDLPALDGPFIHPKAAQRPKLLFVTASSRFRGRQLSPW